MRIVIEIDGTQVLATEVSPPTQRPGENPAASLEPPPELARTARALGAMSAGPAAFYRPSHAAEIRAPSLEIAALGAVDKSAGDFDAGSAAAVAAAPVVKSKSTGRRLIKRSNRKR